MDLLDRLLGHDRWTTGQALQLSRGLADEQLDRSFDIGHRTLRATLAHMIDNVEIWTALMAGKPVDHATRGTTVDDLIERHENSYDRFTTLARRIANENRLDDTYVDTLDDPPTRKPYGGTIVHLVTHNMLHRSEALHILQRLGVSGLPEGDALGWEMNGWSD